MKILYFGFLAWVAVIGFILGCLCFLSYPAHAMKLGKMDFKINLPETPKESIFQEFRQEKPGKCYHTVMRSICIENGKDHDDLAGCKCSKVICANPNCGKTFRLEGKCPRFY